MSGVRRSRRGSTRFGIRLYSNVLLSQAEISKPADQAPPVTVRDWFRRLGLAAPAAVAACVLPLVGLVLLTYYIDPVGQWLRSNWPWGPVIYAAAFVILGGLALMPTWTYSALGGWTFGFAIGLPSALAGYVGGALVGYAIGRWTAGDRLVRLMDCNPKWRAVYDALMGSSNARTLLIVFLVRLASSPFALTNLVFSAARVPIWIYILGTATGLTVRTGVVVWFAAQLSGDHFDYKDNKLLVIGGAAIAVAVVFIITKLARRALANVVEPSEVPARPLPAPAND